MIDDNYINFIKLLVLSKAFLDTIWKFKKTTTGLKTETHWYRCSFRKCPTALKLFYIDNITERVVLSISDDEHVHKETKILKKKRGIDDDTKTQIKLMYKNQLRPNEMIFELLKIGIEPPSIGQLYNFLKQVKKEVDGVSTAKMKDLNEWCMLRMAIPDDEDKPFCGGFKFSLATKKFCLFVSTKRLIRQAKMVNKLVN